MDNRYRIEYRNGDHEIIFADHIDSVGGNYTFCDENNNVLFIVPLVRVQNIRLTQVGGG